MGPGTLYGAVKRMLADGLIEETAERPDPALDDQRRRYYRVTALGARVRAAEVARLETLLKNAAPSRSRPRDAGAARTASCSGSTRAASAASYGTAMTQLYTRSRTRPRPHDVPATTLGELSVSRCPTSTGRPSWQPHP